MDQAYPPLGVEELEDLLARRRGPSRREVRSLLVRALTTAKQLRETRAAYDLEMRTRVAAAGAGRRAYLDPSQVIAFLNAEQRAKLLTQMEKDRLEAHERLNRQLSERISQLSDLVLTAEAVLADTSADGLRAVPPLIERIREELDQEADGTAGDSHTSDGGEAGAADKDQDRPEDGGEEGS